MFVTIFKFARGFVPYNFSFSAFVLVEMNLVPDLCVSRLAPDCRSDAPIEWEKKPSFSVCRSFYWNAKAGDDKDKCVNNPFSSLLLTFYF